MNKNLILVLVVAVSSLFLASCSHNINALSAGNWTKIGAGDYTLLTTGRGLQFTGVSRENSSATIIVNNETGVQVDPQTGSIKGIEEISVEAGPQISGYLCDLGKVCPDAVDKYMESLSYYWRYMLEKAKAKPEPEPEPQPEPQPKK